MSKRKKLTTDSNTSIPLSNVPSATEISSYVKQIVNASLYDFYETEAFEVKNVILNDNRNHGAVTGVFIDEPNQEIKGDVVLPLIPNVCCIPVVGEHVVVVEYNGQHYYTSIINRKNSVNENSIPGTAGGYVENTKYGKTFERKDVRHIEMSEGEIAFQGRFGNSIKLGCNEADNSPNIKIRVGQQRPPDGLGELVKENIERDGSSIYLLENGLPWTSTTDEEKFDGEQVKGKKILIKSDGIFISGRSNIKFRAPNSIDVISNDIKLGQKTQTQELQPVVRGYDLINLLDDMISAVDTAFQTAANLMVTGPSPGSPVGAPAIPVFKSALTAIKTQISSRQVLSETVKTI